MKNTHAATPGYWERFRRKMVGDIGSKPSGGLGRFLYAHPWGHYVGFRLVLDRLCLSENDIYLEVAQGGGVLLSWALQVVNRGAAIDHSPDMVKLATQRNRLAVDAGRLEIVQGDACNLPWEDDTFTAVGCAEAFFFFPQPDKVLREMYRVLRPGGRVVIATMSKGGTSRIEAKLLDVFLKEMLLYTHEELELMLTKAGFEDVTVSEPKKHHQIGYGKKGPRIE